MTSQFPVGDRLIGHLMRLREGRNRQKRLFRSIACEQSGDRNNVLLLGKKPLLELNHVGHSGFQGSVRASRAQLDVLAKCPGGPWFEIYRLQRMAEVYCDKPSRRTPT